MILKANGECVASDVEFAESYFQQIKGLMFRKQLPMESALIFVMDKAKTTSIHMLFVKFPIDVLFLDENKKILKISTLRPWTGFAWSRDTRYIIEMNAGMASKNNLKPGEKLFFRNETD